jgi:DNA-binding NarL/FixJ family response regulator
MKNRDHYIYILGSNTFQNQLISHILEKEVGAECILMQGATSEDHNISKRARKGDVLILVDTYLMERETVIKLLNKDLSNTLLKYRIAFFNLKPGLEIEQMALERGIRGFFYMNDSVHHFIKGIGQIFKNELWVSREIMSRYIMENLKRSHISCSATSKSPLTERETEILLLLCAGVKNEEIARRLFISPNTVKTHIYNIFKKINVPNRLQAALWAAKHLS